MIESRRIRIGILGVTLGLLVMAVGVAITHFTGLPKVDPVTQIEVLPAIPRGWYLVTAGQIIAAIGAHIAILAFVFGWILDRPMTWARASVAALIATLEIVFFFGILPSEWLNLTQGPLEWTSQQQAFTIPRFLVLNNEISISYAVIKDAVSGGYYTAALVALIVGAYKFQERAKQPPPPPRVRTSPYGRPLVRSE